MYYLLQPLSCHLPAIFHKIIHNQGILMWISALSIELWLCGASVNVSDPNAAPGKAAIARRRLNFATSACICSLALWMVAFYNW